MDPGEYVVTMTAAGKTETKTVTVQDDPRLNTSAEDRAKRRAAINRLVQMTKDADQGRRQIVATNTALTNLTDGWKRPGVPAVPDSVKKAADEILAKVKAVLGTFDTVPTNEPRQLGSAGAPLRYTPPTVNQKINRLLGAIDGYSGPPTSRQMADIDDCAKQLTPALAEAKKLMEDVPKLNKLMQDAGVPYFFIDTNNVPPPTGGRGGGN